MAICSLTEKNGVLTLSNHHNKLIIDLEKGSFSGWDVASDTCVFRDAEFRLDKAGNQVWPAVDTTISWSKSRRKTTLGVGLTVTLTFTPAKGYEPIRMLTLRLYDDHPCIEFGWGVNNPFDYPVRIMEVEVLYGGELFCGQTVQKPRVLKSGAGAERNMVEKTWQLEAHNGGLLTYLDRGKRRTVVAGGLVYAEFARRLEFLDGQKHWGGRGTAVIKDQGFRNMNLAFWDPQGKRIPPGTTYMSPDTYYLDMVTVDPFDALEAYGRALRVANDADPNTYDFPTLCGWMVSTRHLGEGKPINNSVGLVEQAKIARERGFMKYSPLAIRLEPDTYCYNNVGDTQQGWWDDEHWGMYGPGSGHEPDPEKGSLRKPYKTFKAFCNAIAKHGCIPFTYFQSSMPSNDFAVAHPDWMLNNDISRLHMSHPHQRPVVRYDYTDPGFRKHCLNVWTRLRKAGMKGIKFDYPETAWASGGGFDDNEFTTASAYAEMFKLCRKGLGDDAYIHERNLGGPSHEHVPRLDVTVGTVDLQRVWGDASHFEPEMASRMGLRWYKSRSVYLYYPDGKSFYSNDKPLPAYKRRAFLTLIAFLSGRLEIGTSIGSMTDEMFFDTTRLFPVFPGTRSPRPVDMLVGGKHPEAYVYEVTPEWHQVLLINNNKHGSKTVTKPMSGDSAATGALGLDPDEAYHVFDFWKQSYLGTVKGTDDLEIMLRAGEAAMLSIRQVMSTPQVVSTNRHIMQGMVECHDITWNSRTRTLRGSLDLVGGEPFLLTVACNGYKPMSCESADYARRPEGKDLIDLTFTSDENRRMSFALVCKAP